MTIEATLNLFEPICFSGVSYVMNLTQKTCDISVIANNSIDAVVDSDGKVSMAHSNHMLHADSKNFKYKGTVSVHLFLRNRLHAHL